MTRCIESSVYTSGTILSTHMSLEECEQFCVECITENDCCSFGGDVANYAKLTGPNYPSDGWTVRYQYYQNNQLIEGVGDCENDPGNCLTVFEISVPCDVVSDPNEVFFTWEPMDGSLEPQTYFSAPISSQCCGENCIPLEHCCRACEPIISYFIFNNVTQEQCDEWGGSYSDFDGSCGFAAGWGCGGLAGIQEQFGREPDDYGWVDPVTGGTTQDEPDCSNPVCTYGCQCCP